MKKSFNIQELLHHKSKRHGTKPMHPSSSTAFQRLHDHDLKHPGSMDLITTKQNKLPSSIDRFMDLQNQIHGKLMLTLDLDYRLKSLEDNREICEVKKHIAFKGGMKFRLSQNLVYLSFIIFIFS
jgi:hypothetical protein